MKEDCGGGGDEENVCQEQGQEDKEIGAQTGKNKPDYSKGI